MLPIFEPSGSPRLRYICDQIFDQLGAQPHYFISAGEFSKAGGGISLGRECGAVLHFPVSPILYRNDVRDDVPECSAMGNIPTLYPMASALQFDIFAACFYMLSRYEEYQPFEADIHGRFEAKSSFAFRKGFLHLPVVDIWVGLLRKLLQQHFPELISSIPGFNLLPTLDIDQPWSFRHKGLIRNGGGLMRDLGMGRFGSAVRRFAVLSGLSRDPFDSYNAVHSIHQRYNLTPVFFIHSGTHGRFDKSIPPQMPAYRNLLKQLSGFGELGLHPSYRSADEPRLVATELQRLSHATGKPIHAARQHYIRIRFPETYRLWLDAGITDDYSMGFATACGFRAGTARSFKWFDLHLNKVTSLTIHPFQFMEGIFATNPSEPENMIREARQLSMAIKENGGTFCMLWHNETLGESGSWKGWRQYYEQIIRTIQHEN